MSESPPHDPIVCRTTFVWCYQSLTSLWRYLSPFFFTPLLHFIVVCRHLLMHSFLQVLPQYFDWVEVWTSHCFCILAHLVICHVLFIWVCIQLILRPAWRARCIKLTKESVLSFSHDYILKSVSCYLVTSVMLCKVQLASSLQSLFFKPPDSLTPLHAYSVIRIIMWIILC